MDVLVVGRGNGGVWGVVSGVKGLEGLSSGGVVVVWEVDGVEEIGEE